jgi:hypothetical protein
MFNPDCSHSRAIPAIAGYWCPDCGRELSDSAYRSAAVGSAGATINSAPRAAASSHQSAPQFSDSARDSAAVGNWMRVYPYRSHGTQYFRFAWGRGHESHSRHIPGGNINSPIAQSRADQIRSQIAAGASASDIEQMIDRWSW